jgi:hypothetical protein
MGGVHRHWEHTEGFIAGWGAAGGSAQPRVEAVLQAGIDVGEQVQSRC